jgi:hypothetical protein
LTIPVSMFYYTPDMLYGKNYLSNKIINYLNSICPRLRPPAFSNHSFLFIFPPRVAHRRPSKRSGDPRKLPPMFSAGDPGFRLFTCSTALLSRAAPQQRTHPVTSIQQPVTKTQQPVTCNP